MFELRLGLALSGGGIRGIAHAGVLRALEENHIPVSVIGGTSSGSMVAALYAMGYSPYYIYVLFKNYARDMINIDTAPKLSLYPSSNVTYIFFLLTSVLKLLVLYFFLYK